MVFKLTDYLDKRKGMNIQSVPVIKEANQILNQYKKAVDRDLIAGDLSKTPTLRSLIVEKYPKNMDKVRALEFQVKELSKSTGFDSRAFLQNKKLELAQRLVTENNLALKYDPDGKKGIFKKLGGEGTRAGQSGYTKQLYDILDTMDTADDKVVKALDVIIEQDLPIKSIKDAAQYKQNRGIVYQMISEISGVGPDGMNKRLKKSKYYTKDFEDTFNYINKIGRQHQDFEGVKFSEAFEFGKTRLAGAAELEGRNLLSFYKDPNTNITNYAFRHWDRTNFNNQPSRVKLYDKKKVVRKPSGAIVPKKGLSLEDAELKWKAGMKVKTKDLIFSYGDSELFDNTTLRTRGPASGLFDEVYDATKDYYNTYRKKVPDPKKPGTTIEFGKLMERDFGKNALAIGHNAPGGVKAEPFKNFQIQTQQMNTALYQTTKNIKSKELQKRVIQNIYGDLSGLTDEKYLQEFVKKPPTIPYREAVVGVKPKDLKTTKAVQELKQISPALKQSIAKLSPNKSCALKFTKGGLTPSLDNCFEDGMRALKEKNINKPHQVQGAKQLMNAGKRIGASTFVRRLLDLGILGEVAFIAGDTGIRMAMGRPFNEAFKAATFRQTSADLDRQKRAGFTEREMLISKAGNLENKAFSIQQQIEAAEDIGDDVSVGPLQDRLKKIEQELNSPIDNIGTKLQTLLLPTSATNIEATRKLENVIDSDRAKSIYSKSELKDQQMGVPGIADYGETELPIMEAPTPERKALPSSKEYLREFMRQSLPGSEEMEDRTMDRFVETLSPMEKFELEALDQSRAEKLYGTQGKFREGGLANLTTTVAPQSGPNSKGLESLRKYATKTY